MSQSSSPPVFPPPLVCVVDTSVLIAFKSLVKIDEQWDLLIRMTALVADGHLAFPRQVAKELAYGRFPDAPGAGDAAAPMDTAAEIAGRPDRGTFQLWNTDFLIRGAPGRGAATVGAW